MTVRAENVIDSPTLVSALTTASFAGVAEPDPLADPEHQEQAVVGAGAEHEHDQQQLGELGHLEPVVGELGDQRPGYRHRQQRGDHRDERREQRPEDQQQQEQDEDQRDELHLVAGVAGLLLLVDLDRYLAGQVHLHARRRR